MLISRKSKTVFASGTKTKNYSMNFPKEIYDKFGANYIMDIYEDKIVMYPKQNLGKIKIEE